MDSSSKRKQGSRRPALLAEGLEERRLLSGRVLDFKFVYHGRAADVGTPTSSQSHPNVSQTVAQRAALRFAAAAKAELSREALLSARHLIGHVRTIGATASPNIPVSTTSVSAPPSSSTPSSTTPTPAGTTSPAPTTTATLTPVASVTPILVSPTTTIATPVATPVNPGGPMIPATPTPVAVTSLPVQGNPAAPSQLWTDEQSVQAQSGATPDMAIAIANDIKALSAQVRTVPGQPQLQTLQTDLATAGVTPTGAQLTTIQADYLAMLTSAGVTNTSLITQTFNDIETYVSAAGVTAADLAMLAADLNAAGLPPGTTMPGTLSCTLPNLLTPTVSAQGQVTFLVPPSNMPTTSVVWTATT